MMTEKEYSPKVLVDTADLSEAEWLEWRRKGIGGSDAAAVLGISPFGTARDLYYDKLNIATLDGSEENWVQKQIGHLLEDLVAEIFQKKTGFQIYQMKKMFCHPQHPFMLADIDYFVVLPSGEIALLEIKTTNYNAKDHWWKDGKEVVPVNYEAQGRHYMCVTNLNHVFYCCLYGNSEEEVIIRHIERDLAYEAEMIAVESEFWNEYVLKKTPPPYKKEQRAKEIAVLETVKAEKENQVESQERRLKELAPAVKNMERLAADFSANPEEILPEPGTLETGRAYREKKAKPLLAQIVKVLRSLYLAYVELRGKFERLQGDYGRVRESNIRLSDRLQEVKLENKAMRQVSADYERVKRAFGPEQVDRILEAAYQQEHAEKERKRAAKSKIRIDAR